MDDLWDLRRRLYAHIADTGKAPPRAAIDAWIGGSGRATEALRELHDRHLIVLDGNDDIQMMLPFSARPTLHRVVAAGRSWWANCAWDSFAIPIALGIHADIESTWVDTGEPAHFAVRNGALTSVDGFIQWLTPANRWWDDIVDT